MYLSTCSASNTDTDIRLDDDLDVQNKPHKEYLSRQVKRALFNTFFEPEKQSEVSRNFSDCERNSSDTNTKTSLNKIDVISLEGYSY